MMMFIARVSTEKQGEFLQTMISLQELKKKEKGMRKSAIYWDIHDDKRFSVIDEWETEKDLGRYLEGDGYTILVGALEILCTEAEVNWGPVSSLMSNDASSSAGTRVELWHEEVKFKK